MKRYGNLFERIANYANLYLAHQNARKGKTWYKEVKAIDANIEFKISELFKVLQSGAYNTSDYYVFERRCGSKTRIIYKLPYYPDRVVHHAILQVILPILEKNLIADTYACVRGRGIHKCAKKIANVLRSDTSAKYCLKLDICKYYPSIDHDILKQKISKLIKCSNTLKLIGEIVDSADGLPIGNYLSQHLANLYLSDFDHWMKEEKRVKHYYRYSDDIVVISDSKADLHSLRYMISEYLAKELRLSVKDNWQVFPVEIRGIDFLGYRFFPGYTLLRKSIAKNFKRKMKMISSGALAPKRAISSFVSYYGWMCHCNTLNLRRNHVTGDVIKNITEACEVLGCKNPLNKMVV